MNRLRYSPSFLARLLPAALSLLGALSLHAKYDLATMQAVEDKIAAVAKKGKACTVALTHPLEKGMATGSGVIVGRNGLILTAAHVVADTQAIDVVFPDGKRTRAKVLGADYDKDVAMVLITEPGDYPFVELGDSDKITIGTEVVALGHPGGFDPKRPAPVRFGRVFEFDPARRIRSDCVLSGGDSGGPLFDMEGRLIGIHCSVGASMSVNNDAPLAALKAGWDRMVMGERWGKKPDTSKARPSSQELGGLDVEKFRAKIIEQAAKSNGALAADSTTIANWLKECGMKEDEVKKLDGAALTALVQKTMQGMAKVEAHQVPKAAVPESELAGLDAEKFKKQIIDDGLKDGGKMAIDAASLRKAFLANGMKQDRLTAMDDNAVTNLFKKVMGVASGSAGAPGTDLNALAKDPSYEGLDPEKLKKLILGEAVKNSGRIEAKPEVMQAWLKECGMKDDKVKKLEPKHYGELLGKLLGGGAKIMNAAQAAPAKIIQEQDREAFETVKPHLDRVRPGIVSVRAGGKDVALGTVVHANGFILTKLSEATKSGGALEVAFADGKSYPAEKVQAFEAYDLALLKIEAVGLAALSIPAETPDVRVGQFLFTPGCKEDMVAMGIASVPNRSLREVGAYIGMMLAKGKDWVEAGDVVQDGPAAKAGLKKGDALLEINGKQFKEPDQFSRYLRGLQPSEKVRVKYRRGTEEQALDVTLGDRSLVFKNRPRGKAIGTEVSDIAHGYPVVFQHDQPLNPQNCGGVVLNLLGDIVGINIARAGRVDSYAIPASTVAALLSTVDFGALSAVALDRKEHSD